MAVASLGSLTLDLIANTAGFERSMSKAERLLERQSKAADKLTASIDPVTGAMIKLTAQQTKLDELWQKKVIPDQEYKRLSGILAEQEKALQSTGAQITKTNAAFTANGMSAKQMANNLRGIPAQFTDIAVSLQAGQSPLTVFLQQGGQLKDMFGGIGPAAKALGGYIVGLINPLTAAAAAAAVLALAYKQGSDETTAFTTALAMTGNTAGTTSGQLGDLAQQISLTGGTVGKASAVLAQLASSTKIPKEAFEQIAVAAIAFEKATGVAAEETVKNFEKIAKDPTAEILKLNESMNFLTASTYERIKALQEEGNVVAAAQVANEAYKGGLARTATSVQQNLGYIETSWNAVKSAAKAAWDAALNIGREDTLDSKLKALRTQLDSIAAARELNTNTRGDGVGNLTPRDTFREEALKGQETQLLVQKAEDDRRAASKGFQQQQQAQALTDQLEIDKLRKETQSNADKREKEIGEYRLLVERRVTAAKAKGDDSLLISAKEQARQIAAINEKYKDPKVAKTPKYREDAGMKMLDTLRQQNAALQTQSDSIDEQTGKYKTLGVQAKAMAEFEQQIADIKTKDVQTADQKSILANEELLRAQLKRNVALEQEVAARKQSYEEAQKLQSFQDNLDSKNNNAQDGLNSNLAGVGQGSKLRERLKEDLAIRKDYQSQLDQLQSQLNKGQISEDLYAKENELVQEALAERLVMQEDYYNQVDEMNSNFFLGISEAWANYAEEATNYQQQAADATSSILNDVTSSVASNIESLIKGQQSIGDFFRNVALDMANAVIGALVKMAAQWLVYAAVQLIAGKTAQAGAATSLIANAQATAFQASLAAFASTAAIPIVGPFLAPAAAATAAAFAAPLVAGVATSALAGMAHDGIDSVPQTGTWLLQKGERVTTAQTSAKLDKTLETIQGSGTNTKNAGTTVNLIEDASKAGQTRTRLDDEGMQQITDVFVSQIFGDGDLGQAMQTRYALRGVGE